MALFGDLGRWFEKHVTHPAVTTVRKVTNTELFKFSSAPLGIRQHTVDIGDVVAVGAVVAGGSALYASGYSSGVAAAAAAGSAGAVRPGVTGADQYGLNVGEAASLPADAFGTAQSLPSSSGMLGGLALGGVEVGSGPEGYGAKPQSTGTDGFLTNTGKAVLGAAAGVGGAVLSGGAAVVGAVATAAGAIAGDPNVAKTALGLGLVAASGAIKSEETPSQKLAQSIANNPVPWIIGAGVVYLLARKAL